MTFETQNEITAVSISRMEVLLVDAPTSGGDDNTPLREASFAITVELSNGDRIVKRGNLVPHLTTAQITGLLDFMANLRTQAENQILPGE